MRRRQTGSAVKTLRYFSTSGDCTTREASTSERRERPESVLAVFLVEAMGFEFGKPDNFQNRFMSGVENHGWSDTGFEGLFPSDGAEAPAITRLQAGESISRGRSAEIVAEDTGVDEKGIGHFGTNAVSAGILGIGATVTGSIESGLWRKAAWG
jgi:hypothetical protein